MAENALSTEAQIARTLAQNGMEGVQVLSSNALSEMTRGEISLIEKLKESSGGVEVTGSDITDARRLAERGVIDITFTGSEAKQRYTIEFEHDHLVISVF